MRAIFWITFLATALTEIQSQTRTPDIVVSTCRRSQIQHDISAQYILQKYVRFSAIDKDGNAIIITDALATMCGYKITQDAWGNMTFRTSLYSCYVIIQNDTYFTVPVQMEISSQPDFSLATSYLKNVSCPYTWMPREIVCETNYMEVSVRRKIPVISEGVFKNEPEDWASAFDPAVVGYMSIWQVVFHKSATQKNTMLVSAAQNMGYGITTTESRTLLRSPYNATESVFQKIGGVTFSTVRATLFYKQRWFIYLIDNAVACPVDDVTFSTDWITWTIPKNITPLLIGAKTIQRSSYQFGLDLMNLTSAEILARKYEITDGVRATVVRIPMGAEGGFYKSHVVNQEHGVMYHIRPFLENLWTDDTWGITKYIIIKDIKTPFERRPPVITNETVPSNFTFTVKIGHFLPDVNLVNITIGDVVLTVTEAINRGYTITPGTNPNGTIYYVLKVPFTDPLVSTKVVPDGTLLTLPLKFGFNITVNETFISPYTVEYIYPKPNVKPCSKKGPSLITTIGNLNPSWSVYIKDTLATSGNGLLVNTTQTSSTVQVSAESALVQNEVAGSSIMVAIPLSIKDSSGSTLYSVDVLCDYQKEVVCLSNGNIQVTVNQAINLPLMKLTLRDKACGPSQTDNNRAVFSFFVNSCQTTRRFERNLMIYQNEITYYSPESGRLLYILNITCSYTTNTTVSIQYGYLDNPTPSMQSVMASLDLILRLSKDISYTTFYGDMDYPLVKYLKDPLYFEAELLYSSDPRVELFLDTCWATSSPDMKSLPSWPIIVNSCEYGEPYQTVFHSVAADSRVLYPSHYKRFEVKTFSFMIDNKPYTGEIHFHCDVIICDGSNMPSDSTCTGIGSCIPARQRLGRSIDDRQNFQTVSSRAVLLAEKVVSYTMHF